MKLKEPYMTFRNKCVLCGCDKGTLYHEWAKTWKSGIPAHEMGHMIYIFECVQCGTCTVFERVPMISAIFTPEERGRSNM